MSLIQVDPSTGEIVPGRQAVIPPPPDGKRPEIVEFPDNWPGVTFTEVGLVIAEDVDRETFEKVGRWLGSVNNKSKLWIADWLLYTERREWGHTYDELIDITGLSYETLKHYAYVGRNVPIQNRIAGSSISMYAAVAPLPHREQKTLLAKAIGEGWDRDMVRNAAKRVRGGSEAEAVEATFFEDLENAANVLPATPNDKTSRSAATLTSGSYEWYTPGDIVERVRRVLGGRIFLDPCSCAEANKVIQADWFFSKEDDGLSFDWEGDTVFMNPPYGDEIGKWVEKLVAAAEAHAVGPAVALLPNRTDTAWFKRLRDYPRCHIDGRLKFWGPDDKGNAATFPSVVIALNCDLSDFAKSFEDLGDIYVRYAHASD